jgi:hypothetical protein
MQADVMCACIHTASSGSDGWQCTGHLLQDRYRHHTEGNTNVAKRKAHTHILVIVNKNIRISATLLIGQIEVSQKFVSERQDSAVPNFIQVGQHDGKKAMHSRDFQTY